jgi:hypothetical protein
VPLLGELAKHPRAWSTFRDVARLLTAFFFWKSYALQVVPDVAPGFHVPAFYDNFVRERREHVKFKVDKREQMVQQQQMRPPPPPGVQGQGEKSSKH